MKKFKKLILILMLCIASITNAQTANPRATYYYCGAKGMGWTLASGAHLNDADAKTVRYVAISRDLERQGFKLKKYILVKSEKYPHLNGVWRIMDRMNPRVKNGIDFLLQDKREQKLFTMPKKVSITLIDK